MNRRQAMTLLPAALLARPLPAQVGRKVMVIGAGIAGLAAARSLKDAGWHVTVIEARDRIGGRIWTSRLWPDQPMDLGASWIHGTDGNPVTALADSIGAARVQTAYDRAIAYGPDGAVLDLGPEMAKAETVVTAARTAAEAHPQDISLADAVTASAAWQDGTATDRSLIRHYVNATFEQEYGFDWAEASAWHFDDDTVFPGPDVLFPNGYDQIPKVLAQGLTIRLGQPVTQLAPDGAGVTATLADGTALTADHAVVTLPLGVLQSGSLRFAEPLSPARTEAITSLRMGLLNKCCLRFDKVAWPGDLDWIEWLGPRDGVWSQWVSLARSTGAPVLMAFHAGSQAREVETLDDDATMAGARDALTSIFGSRFPAPIAAQVTRWSQDPYAQGSYSFLPTGTTPVTRRALAGFDWDNRLAFAGEAAHPDYPATVHGGYLSGRSAARQLIRLAP
jgi:monoamine oxidase